jgi:hypothetical protein
MHPIHQGYPEIVLILVAIIGAILVCFRPRWAFLFIVFGLACRNYDMAVFTRTSLLGEFLNLNDLFVWIALLAMVRMIWQEGIVWAPKILLLIIAILIVGTLQSFFQYGFDYGVIRAVWACWIFPLMMLVSCNMVKNTRDARLFYWTLFFGSVWAALHHFQYMQQQVTIGSVSIGEGGLRTIAFMSSGGIFLVISAFYFNMWKILKNNILFILWIVALALISISYILSFTRTLWIGAALSAVALFLVFYKERGKLFSKPVYALAFVVLIFLIFRVTSSFVFTGVDVAESIDERADFMRHEDTFEQAYQTRESGMETELGLWEKGFILWGVGASYPPDLADATIAETGALGHVAFSTYLAHFGLIGLLAYGFLLPFFTIRAGRNYYFQHRLDYGGAIAVTAMALALYDMATLLSGHQYLIPTGQVPGLIYGAMWGLTRATRVAVAYNPGRLPFPHQWLPVSGSR